MSISPCLVVTNGVLPWWESATITDWFNDFSSPKEEPMPKSVRYYQLFTSALSSPSSKWLLIPSFPLPSSIYPVDTALIQINARITYVDFPLDIMSLSLHPSTITELTTAYDYFLEKSFPMRFTSAELKRALKGRFLWGCQKWTADIGCEGLKAAIGSQIGNGDFVEWINENAKEESLKGRKKSAARTTPAIDIGHGSREVIRKLRKVLQGDDSGLLGYLKGLFIPALEESRNIWDIKYRVPKGVGWKKPPYQAEVKMDCLSNLALEQKFPRLCKSLGVASTPPSPYAPCPRFQKPPASPATSAAYCLRGANIAENARGGKIRLHSPTLKNPLKRSFLDPVSRPQSLDEEGASGASKTTAQRKRRKVSPGNGLRKEKKTSKAKTKLTNEEVKQYLSPESKSSSLPGSRDKTASPGLAEESIQHSSAEQQHYKVTATIPTSQLEITREEFYRSSFPNTSPASMYPSPPPNTSDEIPPAYDQKSPITCQPGPTSTQAPNTLPPWPQPIVVPPADRSAYLPEVATPSPSCGALPAPNSSRIGKAPKSYGKHLERKAMCLRAATKPKETIPAQCKFRCSGSFIPSASTPTIAGGGIASISTFSSYPVPDLDERDVSYAHRAVIHAPVCFSDPFASPHGDCLRLQLTEISPFSVLNKQPRESICLPVISPSPIAGGFFYKCGTDTAANESSMRVEPPPRKRLACLSDGSEESDAPMEFSSEDEAEQEVYGHMANEDREIDRAVLPHPVASSPICKLDSQGILVNNLRYEDCEGFAQSFSDKVDWTDSHTCERRRRDKEHRAVGVARFGGGTAIGRGKFRYGERTGL